jgi:hypothetical protein
VRRLLAAAALVAALLLLGAAPASAHAVLEASTPGDGARLDTPPESVRLEFNEPVSADLGGLRVFSAERIEVYNKVGWSYGFSIDTAWIVDRQTGRSFFLAATLYTNADGVINDDQYEYKTVAWPFLADLAEASARYLWR